eukprot:366097-Chlamydomonas_euryale.AAC.7
MPSFRSWAMSDARHVGPSCLAALLLVLLLATALPSTTAAASLHHSARGLKTYNLPDARVEEYIRASQAAAGRDTQAHAASFKDHPEVQRFLKWSDSFKARHGSVGCRAFCMHCAVLESQF